jgi:two-component system, NarL family, nitrate/nitrite response regulator NarL
MGMEDAASADWIRPPLPPGHRPARAAIPPGLAPPHDVRRTPTCTPSLVDHRIHSSPPVPDAGPSSPSPAAALRVVLGTGVRLYREGLTMSLERRPETVVVGSAQSAAEVLHLSRTRAADVVLLDLDLPGAERVVSRVRAERPALKVVALAVAETEESVVACARAGVAGYVDRGASIDDLIRTLGAVARDELPCSAAMAGMLFRRIGALARDPAAVEPEGLTGREQQILSLIDQGLSNKEIARRLHIGLSTVKNHVHNLLTKLGVARRGAAAALLHGDGESRA